MLYYQLSQPVIVVFVDCWWIVAVVVMDYVLMVVVAIVIAVESVAVVTFAVPLVTSPKYPTKFASLVLPVLLETTLWLDPFIQARRFYLHTTKCFFFILKIVFFCLLFVANNDDWWLFVFILSIQFLYCLLIVLWLFFI